MFHFSRFANVKFGNTVFSGQNSVGTVLNINCADDQINTTFNDSNEEFNIVNSQEGFRAEYIQDGCIIAGQHSVGTELFKVFQLYYNIIISDIPEYILNAPEQLLQSAA